MAQKARANSVKSASKPSDKPASAAPRVPYAPHPPPPREPFSLPGTASLPLGPSSQPGLCLTTSLFFLSESWIPPLRADVAALLGAFEDGYPGAARQGESPCQVMKRLWCEMGWKWLHLLGVPQNGAVRAPWGDSIVRAFLGPERFCDRHIDIAEHLHTEEAPLRQAAALMALYLFVATQPASMLRIYIKVDPDMLEYILALPKRLAPALDAVGQSAAPSTSSTLPSPPTSPVSPAPSWDLSTILHSLLSPVSSFHLIPSEAFLHPPPADLPLVRAVPDPRVVRRRTQAALALLGGKEEAEGLTLGRVRPGAGRGTGKRRRTEEESESDSEMSDEGNESEPEEEEEEGEGEDGRKGQSGEAEEGVREGRDQEHEDRAVMVPEWDVGVLAALGESYRSAKRFRPTDADDAEALPPASTLVRPISSLQAQVLTEAKAKTRLTMRDVAAQGLLDEDLVSATGAEGVDLLDLLDGDGPSAVERFADSLRGLLEVRDRMREQP